MSSYCTSAESAGCALNDLQFLAHAPALLNRSPGDDKGAEPDATPPKPVAMAMVKSRRSFVAAEQRHFGYFIAGGIYVRSVANEGVVHSALRIDPAGEAVIGATHAGQTILHSAEGSDSRM